MRKTMLGAVLALIACAPLLALPGTSGAATAGAPNRVQHRIVWDGCQRGTVLSSAKPDGSESRVIFRRARGFVLNVELNPRGTQVAMARYAPFGRPAELLVVNARNGHARDLLDGLRRFVTVGGIGWSPNGRRLAFEGTVDHRGRSYLWTIRNDGTGLTRRLLLRVPNSHLVWTRHGIYYTGDHGLMRLRLGGRPQRVLSRAGDPVASGNGAWLYVRRWAARAPEPTVRMQRMRADGTGLQRTDYQLGYTPDGKASPIVPSPSGRRMLSSLGEGSVVHDAMRAPRSTDRDLDFLRRACGVDWS